MASTDMRGFCYPLEPLRKRREWELDAAMTAVAALRKQLADKETMKREIEDESITQAALAATAWKQRGDPRSQIGLLAYLAQLQQRKTRVDLAITALHERLVQAQHEALHRQQQMEVLQRHRADELDLYRIDQQRKSVAEADRDWTMRLELGSETSQ